MFDPITHARAPKGALRLSMNPVPEGQGCKCCGNMSARLSVADIPLCPTCAPAYALDEPDIDTVAVLIWLPQMDQGVLGRLASAIYVAKTRPDVANGEGSARAEQANRVFLALYKLREQAQERFGTNSPAALRRIVSNTPRHDLDGRHGTSGLRILMRGRWFSVNPEFYTRTLRLWAAGL
ncbi:hypothetical protein [Komagataeibacter sp. FNDCR2]|uniref:hypothetical protein n=1 Tax=Komagataeibacter sp. FNDCR2 TaxID=2878682 RepID=UPI001E519584|nr:hypothetical protein [Komagataeibacter sp. FNDCR2]MCE2576669.1 hypothetical protein [Komagataeibacter sp. FNDCR2]